jgi:protocatechuate 3,4-dioxygenase alpha subunit
MGEERRVTLHAVTPSQTVGPFFHDCLLRDDVRCDAIVGERGSESIRIEGRVLDGEGVGVPDAVIEAWQAAGFARVGTDEHGRYAFTTVRPLPTPFDRTTMQAPHVSVVVFARGLLNHLFTRIYFADDAATAGDPILLRVPAGRRSTLVARADPDDRLTRTYRFDIVLQGEGETVFFDFRPSRA